MPAFGTPGPPYAVARYWCDGDVDAGRAVFSGVSRQPTLDSVTPLSPVGERVAAAGRERTGGSVLELHAYACEPGVPAEELAERMRAELVALWPEAARLRVRELRARVEAQAPAFTPGGHAGRPGVRTDADGLYLAGDGIRTDFPSALMERSAATGCRRQPHPCAPRAGRPEPVRSIRPPRPPRRQVREGPLVNAFWYRKGPLLTRSLSGRAGGRPARAVVRRPHELLHVVEHRHPRVGRRALVLVGVEGLLRQGRRRTPPRPRRSRRTTARCRPRRGAVPPPRASDSTPSPPGWPPAGRACGRSRRTAPAPR